MTAIDGLVSGLDTTSLINSLITLQAGPQSLLQAKKSTATSLVTALQSLNTKVASLADAAKNAAKDSSWSAVSATSSDKSATAVTDSTAQIGTVTFRVDSLATAQTSLATVPTSFGPGKPTFTITQGGTTTTVTAASSSTADIVEALGGAGTGIKATSVKLDVLGEDGKPTGATEFRLQLTGAATGADKAFSIQYQGADGLVDLDLDEVRAASSATVTLYPGSGAERTLTSSTNTFEDLLTGVDVTVNAVTGEDDKPVTVTVARNTSSVKSLASAVVTNLNTVLSEITSRTQSTTTTAKDGGSVVTGGLFSGDTQIRFLQQDLLSQASLPVDGVSPADIGIVIGRDGTFTFDDAKFTSALSADPDKVQHIVQTVAQRVGKVATTASDSVNGTLTSSIKSEQDEVTDLTKQIADWDDRLAMRRESLEKMYAALETSLSNLNSQSSYLASQIASLTSSTSK